MPETADEVAADELRAGVAVAAASVLSRRDVAELDCKGCWAMVSEVLELSEAM